MVHHTVLLRFIAEATDDQVEAVVEGLRALPEQIPEIRSYRVGRDAGFAEDNADVLVLATFDDQAAWRSYQDHPAHRAVITELIAPIKASRHAAQLDA